MKDMVLSVMYNAETQTTERTRAKTRKVLRVVKHTMQGYHAAITAHASATPLSHYIPRHTRDSEIRQLCLWVPSWGQD